MNGVGLIYSYIAYLMLNRRFVNEFYGCLPEIHPLRVQRLLTKELPTDDGCSHKQYFDVEIFRLSSVMT